MLPTFLERAGDLLLGLFAPRAPDTQTLNYLTKNKPEFYNFIDIDLSTARTNQVYDEAGTFIWIDNQFARGSVELALNEQKFPKFDLRRQKYVEGPFYRFYITNVAGQGTIRLFISRGYHAASEPIESINRAELAARLGSVVSYDRQGDVIWYDDFEDMLGKWYIKTTGACSATIVGNPVGRGGFSCKLTTSGVAMDEVAIYHILPYTVLGKCGLECSFTVVDGMNSLYFWIYLYTGAKYINLGVKIDLDNYELKIDTDAGWTTIVPAGSFLPISTWYLNVFHTLKVVGDFENEKYARLLFDSTSYDVSSYNMGSLANGTPANLEIRIENYNAAASSQTNHIDNVIITQNEP